MSLSQDKTVQHAIPASLIQSSAPKSTITGPKRNAKAKKGLGAKKVGGLGGKKMMKADFENLEKNAEEADKIRQRLSVSSTNSDGNILEKSEETSGESLRLAYQDLTIQEKKNNLKLSKMDSQKKEQAERLGMGMGKTDGVSHSLDMVTINQVNPVKSSRRGKYQDNDSFRDSYSSTRKNRRYQWDYSDSDNDDNDSSSIDFSYAPKTKSNKSKPPPSYTITPIDDGHQADTSILMTATTDEPRNSRHRNVKNLPKSGNGERESMDKYKDAKAISSDMIFGNNKDKFSNEESMRRYQGHSSISSDDFYNTSSSRQPSYGRSAGGSIKEGVKEGVRSVAGKLSNMASDVAFTLQDRFG